MYVDFIDKTPKGKLDEEGNGASKQPDYYYYLEI